MDTYKLLKYHMNCDPDYIVGHAVVAGKLAQKQFKTYQEYETECNQWGIISYNETLFNQYMGFNN